MLTGSHNSSLQFDYGEKRDAEVLYTIFLWPAFVLRDPKDSCPERFCHQTSEQRRWKVKAKHLRGREEDCQPEDHGEGRPQPKYFPILLHPLFFWRKVPRAQREDQQIRKAFVDPTIGSSQETGIKRGKAETSWLQMAYQARAVTAHIIQTIINLQNNYHRLYICHFWGKGKKKNRLHFIILYFETTYLVSLIGYT